MISVIVPVYNVEPYLHKCVDSILAQTYTNLEIILIDDGSPDNCGAICDEYAQKDERVRVIHKENGGVSSARNAGLDAATGEYIAFVDPDDYIPNNYFDALYRDMTDDVDMVVCGAYNYLPNGDYKGKSSDVIEPTVILDSSNPEVFGKYGHYCSWGVLYKRSVIEDLRFSTNYCVGEDTVFYYSALKRCNRIKHTISTNYCYVLRPGSALRGQFNEKSYTEIYAWQAICHLYADNDEIRKILDAEYVLRCQLMLYKVIDADIREIEKIRFLKHEIRHLLPQGLKGREYRKLRYKIKLIADAYFDEKFIFLLKKLYKRLKGRTT